MVSHIFGIWDKKAEAFVNQPFFTMTKGLAIRAFADLAKDKGTDIGKHPEDYSLSHLGTFNHDNGTLTPADTTSGTGVHLVNAIDLIERA